MNELLKMLGIYSIGTVLIVSIVGYLGKRIIEQVLNKDLENFKNNLHSENEKAKLVFEKEIEGYRANLNLVFNKQIQLYTKKSEVIENLYHKLVELNLAILEMTLSFRNVTGKERQQIQKEEFERINDAAEKGNEFFKYYSSNKIYFDKDTCLLVEDVQKNFKEAHSDYSFKHTFGLSPSEMTYEMAKKASERVRTEIPKIMEKLEDEFRLTLGVIEKI